MVKEPQNSRPGRVCALMLRTAGARNHLMCNRKRKMRNFFRMVAGFSQAQHHEVGSLRLRNLQNRIRWIALLHGITDPAFLAFPSNYVSICCVTPPRARRASESHWQGASGSRAPRSSLRPALLPQSLHTEPRQPRLRSNPLRTESR